MRLLADLAEGEAETVAHGVASPPIADEHREILAARKPFHRLTFKVRSERNNTRWVSVSGVPRFDAEGRFLGYRGIGRDVTRPLRIMEDLVEAARKSRI